MKYFCDNCNNLLDISTNNDVLSFECKTCHSTYKADEGDSLRYEETQEGNLVIFQTILNNVRDDPVTLKAHIICPKCKFHIAKQVRLGDELRLINVCDQCGFQWISAGGTQ
jgi:DNA-directed RNA polymerase subunit M/transcription elongation factor TFIIS